MPRVDYPRENWVRVAIRGLGVPPHLRKDAYSVGLMALLNADRKNFPPWQASIHVTRALIDFLRVQTRRRVTAGPAEARKYQWISRGDCALGAAFQCAAPLSLEERAQAASECLPLNWRKCLTARQRLVIDRIYWQGQALDSLAAELGICPNAISQSKLLALGKLRRLMGAASPAFR